MKSIKTSELIGAALDWAVAKCDDRGEILPAWFMGEAYALCYSTKWSLAGPIIEREGISVKAQQPDWTAYIAICDGMTDRVLRGPTPLIAAMRCYCCSKLGDEVDIPEELLQCQHQKS